jgi:type I restriction enzyme S subunit
MTELPNGWRFSRLDEVATVVRGVTYSSKDTLGSKTAEAITLLRATNIQNGVLDQLDPVWIPRTLIKPRQVLVPGDVVIASSSGSIQVVGKSAMVKASIDATFGAFCTTVRATNVLPDYLGFYLQDPSLRQKWSELASGSNINNLKTTDIAATLIPVPPLEEQNRIVEALDDHLSRLDKALADLNAGQELLKAATRSFLHKVLNGSGSTKKLSEVCSLITDGSHFSPKTLSQGHPYITVRDISGDEIDFVGCKYISGEAFAELEKNGCRPLPNDVLFSKDGTVGKVTVVSSDKPFVVLSSLAILRPDQEKVLPSFLKLSLKSPMVLENALGMKTGTAIRRVVLRNLKNLEIDVPPLEKQAQLVEYVDSQLQAFKGIDKALQSQVAMIGGLRRSLLNAAFTGQILEGK